MNIFLKCLPALFVSLVLFGQSFAQSSLVPSHHPVYEWLYIQRVKGAIPEYDYESLPLTRSVINEHLRSLKNDPTYITGRERKNLNSFIQEFDAGHLQEDETHSLITNDTRLSVDRFREWIWSDNEKHIYSYADSTSFLVLDHAFGRRPMAINDDGRKLSTLAAMLQHWRSYGSYKDLIGYHIDYTRAQPISRFLSFGFKEVFEYDGYYNYNWKSLNGQYYVNYHYEAYVTAQYRFFEASIGRGNLKEGVGQTENLSFSRSSIPIDWVKVRIGRDKIRYSVTHATLSWRSRISTLGTDSTITTKNSPQRWVAFHKISLAPFNWITLSAYEMVNYSNRGAELAYINPVNRYAFGEWELQDQDNGWAGASLILRPVNGLEGYTEILIDDLGSTRDILFKKEFPRTSRFGRRYGLSFAGKSGFQLWSEYTRIDPFTYSHPYDLNAHTDKGIGLGSQIGPNADRIEAGAKLWGIGRSFITLSYSHNRQGLDEFDEAGNRIFLSGASPNDGRDIPVQKSNLFLDGDLHRWHRILLDAQWEVKRGYIVKAHYEYRNMIQGEQLGNLSIAWLELMIGF